MKKRITKWRLFGGMLPLAIALCACTGGGSGGNGISDTAPAEASFTLSLDPPILSVAQGGSASTLLTIAPKSELTGTVVLALELAPPGLSIAPNSIAIAGSGPVTQTLRIFAAVDTPPATTSLAIEGSLSDLNAAAALELTVVPAVHPSFSISLSPAAASVVQGSGTATRLTVAPLNGFLGEVALALDTAPAGVAIDVFSVTILDGNPVEQPLTISTAAATPAGEHKLDLKAFSGSLSKTASFALTVIDPKPGAPQLNLSFGIKTLKFAWDTVPDTTNYKLFEKSGAGASYVQVGGDLPAGATSFDLEIALYQHAGASFKLQACNEFGCVDSNEVSVASGLSAAIGYFKASNTESAPLLGNDLFGFAVTLSGDGKTLAVGAIGEDSNATGINGNQSNNSALSSGAAYVFARDGSNWSQQAYIKGSNTKSGHNFGYSVALSEDGDTLVVGALSGPSYVFTRSGSSWSEQAVVNASNSVAISGDGNTLALGQGGSGSVHVWTRNGSTWSKQAVVNASNTEAGDQFGYSVAISGDGDTLAVGAPQEDSSASGIGGDPNDNAASNSGAAYVFTRSGSTWSQQAYVKASPSGANDQFGYSVSLSGNGDTLAVGAYLEDSSATGIAGDPNDNAASNSGAAYVFTRSGSIWSQQAYVKASNTGISDGFGISVALSDDGNALAVGAYFEDGGAIGIDGDPNDNSASSSGAAYIFTRSGSIWSQQAYVKASNTQLADRFGLAIALSRDGDTLAVGAYLEDSSATGIAGDQNDNGASNSGAVYLY